jgi:uncharacterized protein (TIGR02145 family)
MIGSLLLSITCAAAPLIGCPPLSTLYAPAFSPDGRWIAFEARIGDRWMLGKVAVAGGEPTWLMGPEPSSHSASWAPDGTRLVFVGRRGADRRLYTIRADGSGLAVLAPPLARPSSPRWAPNGDLIAYVAGESGAQRLVVARPDGLGPRAITPATLSLTARIAWSPDGRSLAFVARPAGGKDEDPAQLYRIESDGAGLRAIGPPGRRFNPAWSPDGETLLVDGHWNGGWESDDGGWEIFAIPAAGGAERRLTDDTVNDWGPAWSPDGRWIAYPRGLDDRYEIWLAPADRGGEPRRLTRLVYPGRAPGDWPAGGSPRFAEPFTDGRDGERYPTVAIADRVWMARNLAHAAGGTWCYGDDAADCAVNGRLYPWDAARTACPAGWRLASDDDWIALEVALGMPPEQARAERARGTTEGVRLRAGGDSGLAIPISGYRRPDGSYARRGERAAFWTSTPAGEDDAWHRDVRSDVGTIYRSPVTRTYALSVRCVRPRVDSEFR